MEIVAQSDDLVRTFCILDDLIKFVGFRTRPGRKNSLSLSQIATISLMKSQYSIRNWKSLYKLLLQHHTKDFRLPGYKNFIASMNEYAPVLLVIMSILQQMHQQTSGTIKIIDSTPVPVCKNIRINRHKTMKNLATRSKTTTGWFYGLKLHILSDLEGNILKIRFTTAKVGDREVLDQFLESVSESIILGDAGYCSKEMERKAAKQHNILITSLRKNMRRIAVQYQIRLLNLRGRVETVFSVLKERLGLVSTLARSVNGYLAHYIHVLFGYFFSKAIS